MRKRDIKIGMMVDCKGDKMERVLPAKNVKVLEIDLNSSTVMLEGVIYAPHGDRTGKGDWWVSTKNITKHVTEKPAKLHDFNVGDIVYCSQRSCDKNDTSDLPTARCVAGKITELIDSGTFYVEGIWVYTDGTTESDGRCVDYEDAGKLHVEAGNEFAKAPKEPAQEPQKSDMSVKEMLDKIEYLAKESEMYRLSAVDSLTTIDSQRQRILDLEKEIYESRLLQQSAETMFQGPAKGTWAWACQEAVKHPGKVFSRGDDDPCYKFQFICGGLYNLMDDCDIFLAVREDLESTEWKMEE